MGRPKALLPIGDRTFLESILDAISRSPIRRTVVVVGHHREEIEKRIALPSVVFNPDYERGMITSFQAGLRALPPGVLGTFLFLVDHPLVDTATIEAMVPNLTPNRIVLPVFEGRRGHPVLFGADVFGEIMALPPSQGANIVVRKDPGRIVEVSVKAAGILVDIDTPEQYKQLLESET